MTDEQIQALEALYTAAHGRYGTLVDLKRVSLAIKASILGELIKQEFIRTSGRGNFSMTPLGVDKAIENRHVPPADE
jgi:hypothetical protein